MHEGQMRVDDEIVRRLVADQFPQWARKPVRRQEGDGTVNAIFRIGDDLAARFPLSGDDPALLSRTLSAEATAMSELAAASHYLTPLPVAIGDPGPGFPLPWSVQTWVSGAVATPNGLAGSSHFARDLASLLRSLRDAATNGRTFAGAGRGGHLPDSDDWMEVCFAESTGLLPVEALRRVWGDLRTLPPSGPDRMTHGDLTPANLLVDGERLVGVLDGGGFAPADSALDLVAAWHMLDLEARNVLRRELGVSPIEWRRGAAWAFQQSMGLVWYYRESNPGMSALGRNTLERILSDPEVNPSGIVAV
jgi:aminoglycoside phosphotransferase (APT) family kinase protein